MNDFIIRLSHRHWYQLWHWSNTRWFTIFSRLHILSTMLRLMRFQFLSTCKRFFPTYFTGNYIVAVGASNVFFQVSFGGVFIGAQVALKFFVGKMCAQVNDQTASGREYFSTFTAPFFVTCTRNL